MTIIARRIACYEEREESEICYWKASDGTWLLWLPGCGLGCLSRHEVTEHDDGTISVQPSVLTTGHCDGVPVTRHGFLTRGVWNEC